MGDLTWIGWVLAFFGLVTGYIYFRLNRKVKRIEWHVSLDQSLLALPSNTALSGTVSVNIGNETLSRPRAVVVKIKNVGNVGLSTKTMHRPFELLVSGAHVKTLSVSRARAGDGDMELLQNNAPLDTSVIPLPETLLNPGDEIQCSMLVDGSQGNVVVKGEAEDFVISRRKESVSARPTQRDAFFSARPLADAVAGAAIVSIILLLISFLAETLR